MRKPCDLIPDSVAAELIFGGPKFVRFGRVMYPSSAPEIATDVDLGWVTVRVALRDGGRPIGSVYRNGGEYAQRNRKGRIKARLFWKGGDQFTKEYYRSFVRACGFPALEDFTEHLRGLDGSDLCLDAEKSAFKRARRKSIPFEMAEGWFRDLYMEQGGLCAISKLPMYREAGKLCPKMPVPDRIDSSGGYVPGNVRLLRHGVNMMRRDMDDATFIETCQSVVTAAIAAQ